MNYLFTSQRLGFRNWRDDDLPELAAINIDPLAMEFFQDVMTLEQSESFLKRMQNEYEERGYCYFAVDVLETKELIGMIGMSHKTFEADFTPCIDIGWRLARDHWNKGYATEGAKRCLEYGLNDLKMDSILCIASQANVKSVGIMKKIGLRDLGTFEHPALIDYPHLQPCVLYSS